MLTLQCNPNIMEMQKYRHQMNAMFNVNFCLHFLSVYLDEEKPDGVHWLPWQPTQSHFHGIHEWKFPQWSECHGSGIGSVTPTSYSPDSPPPAPRHYWLSSCSLKHYINLKGWKYKVYKMIIVCGIHIIHPAVFCYSTLLCST